MTIDNFLTNKGYKLQNSGAYRGECVFRENHLGDAKGEQSMFLNPQLNSYHCFSCGFKGFLSHLLQNRMNVSFAQSYEWELHAIDHSEERVHKPITPIVDFRVQPQFYLDRGISSTTLRKLRVGSYFDKGVEVATIPHYQKGGYVGSVFVKNTKPLKTITSDEFHKAKGLYAFDYSTSNDYTYIIVVEGFADCWRLLDWGYKVVALGGTAMTLEQYLLLKKYKKIYLALDNDNAGISATEKIAEKYSNTDFYVIPYKGKDPDASNEIEFYKAFKKAFIYNIFS
jgi:DNA primase